MIQAFTHVCQKLGGDAAVAVQAVADGVAAAKQVLARGSVLLSENILSHCLKAFLPDSEASQSEKNKRRNLLISQMSKVNDQVHGQNADMLHPALLQMATMHMKAS